MTETLGEKLRQAREARNYSIRDLADLTRIAPNYLEAIEADNYKILPGGIFNKGFIRSFAKTVGVDEKEAMTDYLNIIAEQTANQPIEEESTRRYNSSSSMADTTGSPLGRLLLTLLVLGLVSAGIYFGVQYLQNNGGFQAVLPTLPTASPTANNTNSNSAAETTPTPASLVVNDGLKADVKALRAKVNLETTLDGKRSAADINPGETKNFTAQQSLKFRYSKYLANELEITLNGKIIKLPPATPGKNGIEFEITRENAAQFVQ